MAENGAICLLLVTLVAVEEEVRGVLAVLLALLTQVDHQMLLVSVGGDENRGCAKINMIFDATTELIKMSYLLFGSAFPHVVQSIFFFCCPASKLW